MKFFIVLLVLLWCPPCKTDDLSDDIDTIAALLIQMKAELQNTKTQVNTMEAKLGASEKLVKELQKENKALSMELRDLKVSSSTTDANVKDVQKQNKALLNELGVLKNRIGTTEVSVEQLKNQNQGMKVAFSAALVGEGFLNTIGPFNQQTTLAFRHVFTNVGNAYNPSTGIFTAPVKGVYLFTLYIYAPANEQVPVTTSLMKNQQQVLVAHGHLAIRFTVNTSNGVSLLLEKGDTVYVQLWQSRIIFDNVNCHTTFSGHLLFTV
ncbi:complement C1q-like protein 2 [Brachyhypopomus gauderio]|uniref:complement C1q-like protein 2 n=1 Tax=Brachyhypopomus gauderio TaxID=698409 RepID=UPI00404250AF